MLSKYQDAFPLCFWAARTESRNLKKKAPRCHNGSPRCSRAAKMESLNVKKKHRALQMASNEKKHDVLKCMFHCSRLAAPMILQGGPEVTKLFPEGCKTELSKFQKKRRPPYMASDEKNVEMVARILSRYRNSFPKT